MSVPQDDAMQQLHEEIAGAGTSLPQPLRAIWSLRSRMGMNCRAG